MTHRYWSRLAVTSVLGVALSYAFLFLAALPIRYLRLTFGRKTFLMTTTVSLAALMGLGFWTMAVQYGSICLLIGFYRELEEKSVSIFLSAAVAVLATMGAYVFAIFGYAQWTNTKLSKFLAEEAKPLLIQIQQVPQFKEATLDSVLWYLPSMFVITMMFILFVSLTVTRVPMSRNQRYAMRMFRLPDWSVWVFIASLGAAFVQVGVDWLPLVAKNILVVTLAAYFFQGIAVFTFFLDRLRIFGLWRFLAYFLAFFQLFIFISGLGLLDYWFDFREQGVTVTENKS